MSSIFEITYEPVKAVKEKSSFTLEANFSGCQPTAFTGFNIFKMKVIYLDWEEHRSERLINVKNWLLLNQGILDYCIESIEDWKGTLIVRWNKDIIIDAFHLVLVECAWNLQGEDQIKHYQGGNSIDCILKPIK